MSSYKFVVKKSGNSLKISKKNFELESLEEGYARIRNIAVPVEDHDIDWALYRNSESICHGGLGIIEKINGVTNSNFILGEKVVYYSYKNGALSSHFDVPLRHLARVPSNVEENNLAANYFKASAAHAMTVRAYVVNSTTSVIIHNANRASSLVLAQHCHMRKAQRVIGLCNNKVDFNSLRPGSYSSICYYDRDWVNEIVGICDGIGASICYDNIGGEISSKSVEACRFASIIVSSGFSSGDEPKLPRDLMLSRSMYYTVPMVFDYKENKAERFMTDLHVFKNISDNILGVSYKTFKADECQKAIDVAMEYPHYTPLIIFE